MATAWRFTPFKLTLAPGDPHSYIVDGETKPMEATRSGSRRPRARSRTRSTRPSTGRWSTTSSASRCRGRRAPASRSRDVNATNFRYLNHFFDNNKAQSVAEYDTIQRRYQGIPWVNSIAADSEGNAYYSMQGAIPNVSDELAARCNVLAPVYETLGLPVLDGSRSDCNWEKEPGAVAPGHLPGRRGADAGPRRLRPQRQRQPLADQPARRR